MLFDARMVDVEDDVNIEPQPYQKALNGGVTIVKAVFYGIIFLVVLGYIIQAFEAAKP